MGSIFGGSTSQGGGGLSSTQRGPAPRSFVGDQAGAFDPMGDMMGNVKDLYSWKQAQDMAMADKLRRKEQIANALQEAPRSPFQDAMMQMRIEQEAQRRQPTPRDYGRPGMSPQGQLGFYVDPADIPANLQGVIRGGFYSDNPAGNFTYNVMPNQYAALEGGRGQVSGSRFSVTDPATSAAEQARALMLQQQAQQAMAQRMYGWGGPPSPPPEE